jgi:hypothetical protein
MLCWVFEFVFALFALKHAESMLWLVAISSHVTHI